MGRSINLKKHLLKIMPAYSWFMLSIMVLFNCITYFGTRIFTTGLKHYSVILPLDKMLPFIPFFIAFYILAYVQWITGYIIIGRQEKHICIRIFTGELIAKAIALICFVIFPTTIEGFRPEAASLYGHGIWHELTAYIYSLDAPDNLFPSIHCLESWVCLRGTLKIKNVPKWYACLMVIMTLLVFASTVLVKQHVLIDIAGGVIAVEIGMFIANKITAKIDITKGLT